MRALVGVGLLLAWAMPPLAATVVWQWLFDTQYGLANWLVTATGVADYRGHSWLTQPLSFFAVAAIVVVWMGVPFVALTLFAGLTQLPRDVVEAAQLDGVVYVVGGIGAHGSPLSTVTAIDAGGRARVVAHLPSPRSDAGRRPHPTRPGWRAEAARRPPGSEEKCSRAR